MNKNQEIFKCAIDEESGLFLKIDEVYNSNIIPPGILINNGKVDKTSINKWWLERSIPDGRKGLKAALNEMGLDNPKSLIIKGYGLSLSDQYWIRPDHRKTTWEDINYFDNAFSDYVGSHLMGKSSVEEEIDLASPCNTSGGKLIKKWVIENNKRCLIKGGSGAYLQEPFNEVLASNIHKRLNVLPCVNYKLIWDDGNPYSSCENFVTKNTELVTAYQVLNIVKKSDEISDYQHYINICEGLEIKEIKRYLDYMLITDYIIGNVDRHYNNFGLIRNVQTLQYIGAAPIYDSGNSMWFNTSTLRIDFLKDIHSMPFKKLHSEQIKLASTFENIDLNKLQGIEEDYYDLLSKSPDLEVQRVDKICKGLQNRIKRVKITLCQ